MATQSTRASRTICYVTMVFPVPSEAFLAVELNALKRRGLNVEVVTLRARPRNAASVAAQQEVEEIPVDASSIRSILRGLTVSFAYPAVAWGLWRRVVADLWRRPLACLACLWWSLRCLDLWRRIEARRPDAVHLFWGHAPAMLGWLVQRSPNAPRLTMGLSAYDLEFGFPLSFSVARRSAGVRTKARSNVAQLVRHGVPADLVTVAYQGIRVEQFRPLSKVPGRIAVASRLIRDKGVLEAIHVAHSLSREYPDTSLVIHGIGPLRAEAEKLARDLGMTDRVKFAGHVSHAALAQGLGEAELFLLHSTHSAERLPNVIKEAAAAGCCCLTTPTPGIEELIVDGESGFLLPPGDLRAWTAQISRLRRQPTLARECGERARARVLAEFDVDSIAGQLETWWRGSTMPHEFHDASPSAA